MTVMIGHASLDENKKIKGGAAGDQTGAEVCTRSWYNKGWEFLARPKDKSVAEKIASACEAGCANPNIGYDQNQRNTLLNLAKAAGWDLTKISTACEADCSSFVTCCVMAAGIQIWSGGNAPTTRTLRSVLKKTGQFDILTDARYISSADSLCRGDILCKAGSHTVIVLDNGPKAAADRPASDSDTKTPAEPEYTVHTVVKGNSLWAISAKYLGKGSRYKEIMELNGLTSTVIRVGQKLKIPMK